MHRMCLDKCQVSFTCAHACTCISLGSMLQSRSKVSWFNYNTVGWKRHEILAIFLVGLVLLICEIIIATQNFFCKNQGNHVYLLKTSLDAIQCHSLHIGCVNTLSYIHCKYLKMTFYFGSICL